VVDGEHAALVLGPLGETGPSGVEQRGPFLLTHADSGHRIGGQ
jgi:hypothetical protein